MATAHISKKTVDAARSGRTDRFIWDDKLAGFGLKVTPAGRKVFIFQYRSVGRTRRITIGDNRRWTPARARDKAQALSGLVASGTDPAAGNTKADTVANVFKQFADEHGPKLKASTAKDYDRLARLFILPPLGTRPLGEISRAQIARLHHSMRATPYQGNRTLALLSKFFTWAERRGFRPDGSNPCRHVDRFREGRRERFLSQAELARLGAALRDVEASPWVIAALRLLLLTGARLNEILTLRWEHVSEERACIFLPDSKTSRKTVLLNEQP